MRTVKPSAARGEPAPREDGWEELRREIEALPGFLGPRPVNAHEYLNLVDRAAVLAIVDLLAAARGEPQENGWLDALSEASEGRGDWLLGWQAAIEAVRDRLAAARGEPDWQQLYEDESARYARRFNEAARGEPPEPGLREALARRVDDLIGQLQAAAFDDPDMGTAQWERKFAAERQAIADDFAALAVTEPADGPGEPT